MTGPPATRQPGRSGPPSLRASVLGIRYRFTRTVASLLTPDPLRQAAEDLLTEALRTGAECLCVSLMETGEHLAADDAYLDLYGYPRQDLIGRTSVELGVFATPALRQAYIIGLREKGVFHDPDVSIRTKSGHRVSCRLSAGRVWLGDTEAILVHLQPRSEPSPVEERLKRELEMWQRQAGDLLQHMPVGFLSLDERFHIAYANARGEALLGRPIADLIGSDAFEVFPKTVSPSFGDAVRRAMKEHIAVDAEDSYSPTGRWFEVTAYPSDRGLSVFLRDVTERKEAAGRIAEAEEKYRALVEQVPAVIYLEGVDGHLIYGSPRLHDLLGVTAEEVIADPELWDTMVHPDDAASVAADDSEAERTGDAWHKEYRTVAKDGRVVWVRDDAVLVRDDDGNQLFWRGVMIDVTERKEIEIALRAAEDQYRQIVEQVPAVIYIQDLDGNIIYLSPQYERLFGYTAEERMADRTIWTGRIHPDDRERVLAEDEQTYETGSPFNMEYRLHTKDGRLLWVQDSSVLVYDEDGEPRFWQGVMVDETALKRTQEELTDSLQRLERISEERRLLLARLVDAQERERTQIASDIHDDSVQVITAVGLRLHALRRQLTDPQQVALLDRLDRTVTDAVARLRRLMFDLRPPALERDGLATAVESWLSQAASDSGFDYRVIDHLKEEPPENERVTLYRICAEALSNIRKHAEASSVVVTMETVDGGVLIEVQDDGVGFDVPASEQESEDGHIGLSAIRERCRMSGGWCRIESERGKGTTVRFWIPRLEAVA
jgi:PAS domain S-box-containing protein